MEIGIVGAGLAGLAAATELSAAGHGVTVFEASDGPGGRVRTDVIEGRRLDRGFQIMLAAYPECRAMLDYDRLDLRAFRPGALVRIDDRFHRVGDPIRDPGSLSATVSAPIGSLLDKARILKYRLAVSRGSIDDLFSGIGTTTAHHFDRLGFSERMVDRFLGPLFRGITLEPALQGSRQVADFVFRMLAAGDAVVPAEGMGAISDQLAAGLPDETIRYGAVVDNVTATSVAVEGGDEQSFDAVVVAADASEAARLVGTPDPGWNGVTSVWVATPMPPVDEPVLVLDGTGAGPINSLAPLSLVSDRYAPAGSHLFVMSAPTLDPDVADGMRSQLVEWFGPVATTWETVRVDRIEKAQPRQLPGHDFRALVEVDGIVVAGDHRRDASLNGALASGRAAAAAILGPI